MRITKLLMIMLAVVLISSCQKAKEPAPSTQAQPQKEEVKKSADQKPNVAIQDEGPIEVVTSPLTEAEQKAFGGGALATPIENEAEAINYLKLLLKGSPKTIRWYQQAIKENNYTQKVAREWYEGDIGVAVEAINTRTSAEGFKLVAEVLKTKKEYPKAMAKAASAMKYSQNTSIIPLLRDVAKHPDHPNVRLEAAGSLLYLGDADTALPILEELTEKEGFSETLRYLFRDKGKIIDERGYKIVEKALTNKNAAVRISAAKILFEAKKLSKAKMEEIALETLKIFKSEREYGITHDSKLGIISIPGAEKTFERSNWQMGCDWGAIESAISILVSLKSKKAIPALEKIANNPEGSYLANTAARAIENLAK
jgi:HEAT repeat protein